MSYASTPVSDAAQLPRQRSGFAERIAVGLPAAAVGVGVVACLLWTAREEPLPALGWAAAVLFLFVQQDVSRRRIPHRVTLPALALALGVGFTTGGVGGLGEALLGAGAALAVTFLPFSLRWLGAGDVKGCMVFGAFWGTAVFLGVFWWMLVVGGRLAVAKLAAQGGFGDLMSRWFASAHLSFLRRRPIYVDTNATAPERAGLPFAVAMGLGAAAFQLLGMPW
jgi:Flp pilus assembly protein protease CpaA